MRKTFAFLVMMTMGASIAGAQSGSTSQSAPAAKAGAAAKPSGAAKPAAAAKPAVGTKPTAIINTSAGKMTCTLFPDKAPIGVENFIGLASGTKDWKNPVSGATKHGVPLYDGTIFHRVIPGFMIQGGDPAGNGTGDPGYKFKNETSPDLMFDQPGRLAYANAGPGTNGSQFFITEVATPHLNGGYTIFGQCDEATVAMVKVIAHMATDPSTDKPFRPVKIIHISIVHSTGTSPKPGAGTTVKKPAATTPKPAASPN
jgi:peptidyl-prolyl cis-trans isomerase A (cyclophilin A)